MNDGVLTRVSIDYDPDRLTGKLSFSGNSQDGVWYRIRQSAASKDDYCFSENNVSCCLGHQSYR